MELSVVDAAADTMPRPGRRAALVTGIDRVEGLCLDHVDIVVVDVAVARVFGITRALLIGNNAVQRGVIVQIKRDIISHIAKRRCAGNEIIISDHCDVFPVFRSVAPPQTPDILRLVEPVPRAVIRRTA